MFRDTTFFDFVLPPDWPRNRAKTWFPHSSRDYSFKMFELKTRSLSNHSSMFYQIAHRSYFEIGTNCGGQ